MEDSGYWCLEEQSWDGAEVVTSSTCERWWTGDCTTDADSDGIVDECGTCYETDYDGEVECYDEDSDEDSDDEDDGGRRLAARSELKRKLGLLGWNKNRKEEKKAAKAEAEKAQYNDYDYGCNCAAQNALNSFLNFISEFFDWLASFFAEL